MNAVLHPVGPQRARVYWVRRLVVVLVLVLLATTGWAMASRLLGGGDAAAASGSGQAAAEPAEDQDSAEADTASAARDDDATGTADDEDEDEDPAVTTPVDCAADALQVSVTASGQLFDEATDPVLTATVTNVGDVPCTVDAGDANREVLITSGADRIWSSKDCATPETASRQLLLGAGAADTVELTWDRTRTAEGCPADLPEPRAGTYQAVSTLGTVSSVPVVFALQ